MSHARGTTKVPSTEWTRGRLRSCGSPGASRPGWPLALRSNGRASSASWNWAAKSTLLRWPRLAPFRR
eukprot:10187633-Alexandrium_andersonii.AAC.1